MSPLLLPITRRWHVFLTSLYSVSYQRFSAAWHRGPRERQRHHPAPPLIIPSRSLSYEIPEAGKRIVQQFVLGSFDDFPTRECWSCVSLHYPSFLLAVWTLKSFSFYLLSFFYLNWQHSHVPDKEHIAVPSPIQPPSIFLPLSSDVARYQSSWSSNLGLVDSEAGWRTHGCLNFLRTD